MAETDKTRLGIGLVVAVFAVIGREYPWIAAPLTLFAVFLIVWGREGKRTETFIGSLPGGRYILKSLDQLDLILSPRDQEYDQHIRTAIVAYDDELRTALRTVFRTRNSSTILAQHLDRFVADGLIEYPKDGPGWIKPDLRRVVGRTLDELRT